MVSTKANVGIWSTVITTVGGIITTVLVLQLTPSPQTQDTGTQSATQTQSAATGTVVVPTGNVSNYVYSNPVRDLTTERIGELSDGQQVDIVCTVQGPPIMAENGRPTTVWDKIRFNSGLAYVSDAELQTYTDQVVAPSC